MAFFPSITTMIRSDSCIASRVCLNMSCFMLCMEAFLPSTLTYTPGVSITLTSPSIISYSLRSLVKPASLSTMAKCSPIKQLNNVDLPVLGKPTRETLNCFLFYYWIVCQFFLSLLEFLKCIFSISPSLWRISCFFRDERVKGYRHDGLARDNRTERNCLRGFVSALIGSMTLVNFAQLKITTLEHKHNQQFVGKRCKICMLGL